MKHQSTYDYMGRVIRAALCVFLFSLPCLLTVAQKGATVTVSGTVSLGTAATDITGTTVQEKGKSNAVTTDNSGRFTITVQKPATLVFSHVGFQSVERPVSSNTDINITLDVTSNNLDQVVVVSYGTRK